MCALTHGPARRSGALFCTEITSAVGRYGPEQSTGERRSVTEWYGSRRLRVGIIVGLPVTGDMA